MADSSKQFNATNRIPSRPLSYEYRDLAQPKELLVDYNSGIIYVVTATKEFINITDAIKDQISMDADSVRDVEIDLPDGSKVTIEAGIVQTETMSTTVGEHTTKIGELETDVDNAASAAASAANAASTAQSTANTAKSTADANKTSITNETKAREAAVEELTESISKTDTDVSNLTQTVTANKTAADQKDTELANSISNLSDTVTANKNALDTKNAEQDKDITALKTYNETGVLILDATISADADDWSDTDGDAPYKQTITLEGILETDYPIVDINLSDDYGTAVDELESYGRIMKILTFDGYIEVYATEPTSVALNIFMKTDRKSTN